MFLVNFNPAMNKANLTQEYRKIEVFSVSQLIQPPTTRVARGVSHFVVFFAFLRKGFVL